MRSGFTPNRRCAAASRLQLLGARCHAREAGPDIPCGGSMERSRRPLPHRRHTEYVVIPLLSDLGVGLACPSSQDHRPPIWQLVGRVPRVFRTESGIGCPDPNQNAVA